MIKDQGLEQIWKGQFEDLKKHFAFWKTAFFIGELGLIFLWMMGMMPFYGLFLFAFGSVFFLVILLFYTLKCPNCEAHLLTKQGIMSAPNCYSCGFKLADGMSLQEKSAQTALEKIDTPQRKDKRQIEKVDWTPLSNATSNFDQHRLVEMQGGDLAFKARWPIILFGSAFIAAGLGMGYMMFLDIPQDAKFLSTEFLILLIPLLFAMVGTVLIYFARMPRLFSLTDGVYQKGREKPILLMRIGALQLLSHEVSSNDGPRYTNYQLNLVLGEDERKNIVHYANKDNAIADSQKLAEYLGVKLWNGI